MNSVTTFDSTKEALSDMLRAIHETRTQLPDFQRGWVWEDERIRSLLASISLSFPVGTVMMLETGNESVRFKPRLVEGVPGNGVEPERLILDGQQRLTALYQSIYSGQVAQTRDARRKPIKRWYYMDIRQAVNPNSDRDEAIISLPEDKAIRNFRGQIVNDYSTPDAEYAAELFPLSQVFSFSSWRRDYNKFWKYDGKKAELIDQFEQEVIKRFEQYQMPLILLRKPTPKEAVCLVFEKVNTGGVSLTVFELLTDDYSLRDDWNVRHQRLRKQPVLGDVRSDEFLQAMTLLATYDRRRKYLANGEAVDNAPGVSCKRREILRLTLDDYKQWADLVTRGFELGAKLIYGQNIFTDRDLPYRTQLVPLAAVLALLGDEAQKDSTRAKLSRWYWCGIFGELYGSAVETRFAKDLPEILQWIHGEGEPDTVQDANFVPARLQTLHTRNSAAYKGINALLMRDGGLDFRSGERIDIQTYFDDSIDIHHIFPRDWCIKQGIDARRYDCVVNKTPLAAKTNRIISNRAPSDYLERLQQSAGINSERMDEILESHLIFPLALRVDDFTEFFAARENALLTRIEEAMGKPIMRDAYGSDENDFDSVADEEEGEVGG